jgi:hypothetical protein
MTFGKQSGPPASSKQLNYLLSLVQKEGFTDFREARHPLGLTQRQAGGKFTIGEASALIDRLVNGESSDDDGAQEALDLSALSPPRDRDADDRVDLLRGIPAATLAAELERRGWTVAPPTA